jgi:hypothetical protein
VKERHRHGVLLTVQINMFMCLLLAVCWPSRSSSSIWRRRNTRLFIGMVLSIPPARAGDLERGAHAEFNAAVRATGISWPQQLVNVVGFALVPFPPLLLLLFLHSWISRPIPRILLPLYAAPLLANVILALLSYHGGVAVQHLPLNEYSRGSISSLAAVSYAYFLLKRRVHLERTGADCGSRRSFFCWPRSSSRRSSAWFS